MSVNIDGRIAECPGCKSEDLRPWYDGMWKCNECGAPWRFQELDDHLWSEDKE